MLAVFKIPAALDNAVISLKFSVRQFFPCVTESTCRLFFTVSTVSKFNQTMSTVKSYGQLSLNAIFAQQRRANENKQKLGMDRESTPTVC